MSVGGKAVEIAVDAALESRVKPDDSTSFEAVPEQYVPTPKELSDARWNALNLVCAMAIRVVNVSVEVTQGLFGEAYEQNLLGCLASVELNRLYPVLLHDVAPETLVEFGLKPLLP